jgi:PTH1 family peptidyl-tRNA hydrolase
MFRKKPATPNLPIEWMIVGLGNPGAEYRGTRHNVGFDLIDHLAKANSISVNKGQDRAMVGSGLIDGVQVLLAKPLTYMNLSGQSVAPLARRHGVKPARILVIADDLDLPLARLRLRADGSHGGHNGHRSLINSLGTTEYPRLKIGIGRSDDATVEHVLGRMNPADRALVDKALVAAERAVSRILAGEWNRALEEVDAWNKTL